MDRPQGQAGWSDSESVSAPESFRNDTHDIVGSQRCSSVFLPCEHDKTDSNRLLSPH